MYRLNREGKREGRKKRKREEERKRAKSFKKGENVITANEYFDENVYMVCAENSCFEWKVQ